MFTRGGEYQESQVFDEKTPATFRRSPRIASLRVLRVRVDFTRSLIPRKS